MLSLRTVCLLFSSSLAAALERDDEAKRFAQYAAEIRTAIRKHLWNKDKQAFVDGLRSDGRQSERTSQQANMIPLVLGFTEGEETRGALAAVKRAGYSTAPMIVRFLVQAYGELDEDEALMEFLLDPKGRNRAYIVADGGSFTYENWLGRNRKDPGARSESHPVGAYADEPRAGPDRKFSLHVDETDRLVPPTTREQMWEALEKKRFDELQRKSVNISTQMLT